MEVPVLLDVTVNLMPVPPVVLLFQLLISLEPEVVFSVIPFSSLTGVPAA